MFLQNMNLLLSKTPTQQIQTYVFPLIFAALEADNSQIQVRFSFSEVVTISSNTQFLFLSEDEIMHGEFLKN